MEQIKKIWGFRTRLRLDKQNEIDYLQLEANSFCSLHTHKHKINTFYVIKGEVEIQTEFGNKLLKMNESFTVKPPLKHRFICTKDAIMIEMAYVDEDQIDPEDIERESLGGKIIDDKELTIDDLKEKGLLEL